MSGKKFGRRQILKIGSAAALSAIGSPAFASVKKETEEEVAGVPDLSGADNEICYLTALEMLALLRAKKISARELMQAHLQQIEKINSKVNAIITLVPENELLAQALAADEAFAKGKPTGALHGLPVAAKDLTETKGIRTTYGSPLWKDNIPTADSLLVSRQKKAGAIIIGKSNVPELGMGSQTFNPIFGKTLNPYDLTKTCGGSTGGGAVSLACGMVPLADGSDMGGSLRNPGSFCNVVGLRPSPGRVPAPAAKLAWGTLGVLGPMARTVADCALLLSVQAGPDSRSPISIMEDPAQFAKPLQRNFKGVRVAFVKDFGLPWEKEVKDAVDAQRKVFESLGCIVEVAEPDMTDANECFVNFRHWQYEAQYGEFLATDSDKLNEYTKWHITEARKLTGPYLSRLEIKRSNLFRRMQQFMEKYEFLVLPTSQVLPFDVNTPYPKNIESVQMETYLDWMKSSYYISIVGNPALSMPCAFSKNGLPIGLQIVGRFNKDWSVLQMGAAFEAATGVGKRRPVIHS